MNNNTKKSPIHNLVDILKEKGLEPSLQCGMTITESEIGEYGNVIGIVRPQSPVKFLGINLPRKGSQIGYFRQEDNTDSTKWIMEIYGRNNIISLADIALELSNTQDIDVEIRLCREIEYVGVRRPISTGMCRYI